MDKKKELMYIAKETKGYLNCSSKNLETRLQEIEISKEELDDIKAKKAMGTIVEKGLGMLGPLGDIANTLLNWNESVNNEMKEAKQMILMEQYFAKSDDHEKDIEGLKNFLTSPQGNTLFNKILRILDDTPPDEELTGFLSTALKNIINGENFETLFEKHKYALAQIERLTPQALAIISDHETWPKIQVMEVLSTGPRITQDFYTEFTAAYCTSKCIEDQFKYQRVLHAVLELQRQGYMEAFKVGGNGESKCNLTIIGGEILGYIK